MLPQNFYKLPKLKKKPGFFFNVLYLLLQAVMPGHTPHKLPLTLSSKHALVQSRGLHAEERKRGLKKRQHTCNFGTAKCSIITDTVYIDI